MQSRFSFSKAWKNKWMLVSGFSAISLFGVAPSTPNVEISVCAFIALLIWAFVYESDNSVQRGLNIPSALISLIAELTLISGFVKVWSTSQQVAAWAGNLGLLPTALLLCVGIFAGLVAFPFIYRFFSYALNKAYPLFNIRINTDSCTCWKNIQSNWYVLVSALAFFLLESQDSIESFIGVFLAFTCVVGLSSQLPKMVSLCKDEPLALKVFAALSASGMCLAGKRACCKSPLWTDLVNPLPQGTQLLNYLSAICAVVGLIFAFLFIVAVLSYVRQVFVESGVIKRLSRMEGMVYGTVFLLFLALSVVAFTQSQAFYGTVFKVDVIYAYDSPVLAKNAADLTISFSENDLRHPLFAVFAAPFTGGMYFLASILSESAHIPDGVFYALVNSAHIALMLVATILLADIMVTQRALRVCFFLVFCSSYTVILSALMIEQFNVAFFWLILVVYAAKYSKNKTAIAYFGATGTMITSGCTFLVFGNREENKNITAAIASVLETGLKVVVEFLAVLIAFGRFDVLYNLTPKLVHFYSFVGSTVSAGNKLLQYLCFVANCFVSPNAGIDTASLAHKNWPITPVLSWALAPDISWQLAPAVSVNVLGLVIIALSVISLIVCRRDDGVSIAGFWAFISVLILFLLGWGTGDNGLIIYSLYFGWAFYSLLFKLLEKIGERVSLKYLPHALSAVCFGLLLWLNIPGICDMISFAITYYPA